jgi:hypothetical protein
MENREWRMETLCAMNCLLSSILHLPFSFFFRLMAES